MLTEREKDVEKKEGGRFLSERKKCEKVRGHKEE